MVGDSPTVANTISRLLKALFDFVEELDLVFEMYVANPPFLIGMHGLAPAGITAGNVKRCTPFLK